MKEEEQIISVKACTEPDQQQFKAKCIDTNEFTLQNSPENGDRVEYLDVKVHFCRQSKLKKGQRCKSPSKIRKWLREKSVLWSDGLKESYFNMTDYKEPIKSSNKKTAPLGEPLSPSQTIVNQIRVSMNRLDTTDVVFQVLGNYQKTQWFTSYHSEQKTIKKRK